MTTLHTVDTSGTVAAQQLTDGHHLIVDALKLNDIRTIYGLVGIPITDLARIAQAEGFRYIGFRHESDAVHAAAAAGFHTKKPGVSLTVSGPGFLNGLVALANATTNCFPVVQISGSSDRHIVDLKRGDYEELDQMTAAERFAKAAYRVDRAEDIGRGVARAIRTAVSGRPGAATAARTRSGRPGPHAAGRRCAAAGGVGQGSRIRPSRQADSDVHRNHRAAVFADVDGQGAAARQPPAVGGRRPVAGIARSR